MSMPLMGLTGFLLTLGLIGLGFPVSISMAVIGIISTQLLDHYFIRRFSPGTVGEADNVKISSDGH